MPSFAGLIAGALGGAAEGYGQAANMEMKKQSEVDLKKQLLDVEADKKLAIDAITRERDVAGRLTEETRVRSPEYLKQTAEAEAAKYQAMVAAGVPAEKAKMLVAEGTAAAGVREAVAPANASADIVEGASKLGVKAALAPATAAVDRATYEAGKALAQIQAKDATAAQIQKARDLVSDPTYMADLRKTDLASHAHLLEIANIRASSLEDVADKRLKAKTPEGGKPESGIDLDRQVKAARDEMGRALGVPTAEINGAYASLKKKADAGDPVAKAKLADVSPINDRWNAASAKWTARNQATGKDGTKPPLSNFERN
jgi:hypothetical protein